MKKSKSKEDELKKFKELVSTIPLEMRKRMNVDKVYLEGWIDGAKWMDQELDEWIDKIWDSYDKKGSMEKKWKILTIGLLIFVNVVGNLNYLKGLPSRVSIVESAILGKKKRQSIIFTDKGGKSICQRCHCNGFR